MKYNRFLFIFLISMSGFLYGFTAISLFSVAASVLICLLVIDNNLPAAIYSSIAATVICYVSVPSLSSVVMFLLTGVLPGILLGQCYRKNCSLQFDIAVPACCHILSYAYLFFSYKKAFGTNMFDDAFTMISDSMKETIEQMSQQYPELADPRMAIDFSGIFKGVLTYIPAIIIICSCFVSIVIVMITKKSAADSGFDSAKSFSRIYASGGVSFIMFVCLVAGYMVKNSYGPFFTNVLIVLVSYYFLCGVSVGDFFLRKKIKSAWLRILIYAGVVLAGSLTAPYIVFPAILFAGMVDVMFDFRKIRTINLPM